METKKTVHLLAAKGIERFTACGLSLPDKSLALVPFPQGITCEACLKAHAQRAQK